MHMGKTGYAHECAQEDLAKTRSGYSESLIVIRTSDADSPEPSLTVKSSETL